MLDYRHQTLDIRRERHMIRGTNSLFSVHYLFPSLLTTRCSLLYWMPASAGMTCGLVFSPFCFSFVIPAQAGIYPSQQETRIPGYQFTGYFPSLHYFLPIHHSLLTAHYSPSLQSQVYGLRSNTLPCPREPGG